MTSPFKLSAAALALFAGALLAARIGLPEYAHRLHPVGLRGAMGMPWATAFNLAAFVVPGVLLAGVGLRLREALAMRGWLARIGVVLVQLSALAFAAQGLLPLDPRDVDAAASRWHVLAWMLWWIAFVPGALLLAVGAGRWRGFAGACAVGTSVRGWVSMSGPRRVCEVGIGDGPLGRERLDGAVGVDLLDGLGDRRLQR